MTQVICDSKQSDLDTDWFSKQKAQGLPLIF